MRGVLSSFLVLSLLQSLATLPVVFAEEPAPKEGSDDEDLELDLDDDGDLDADDADGASAAGPVEDFDKDMAEADRTVRMKACFTVTVARLQSAAAGIEELVQQVIQQKPGTTKDQAVNLILFNWMMTCYFNIEPPVVKTLSDAVAAGATVPAELVQGDSLFAPQMDKPQTPQTASKAQWSLLESVLQEQSKAQQEKQKQARQQQQGSSPGSQPAPVESTESSFTKALKVLVPFTIIFGVLGLGTMMLVKKDNEAKVKKEKKSDKKKKN